MPRRSISMRHRDEHLETGQVTADLSKNPVEVLQQIAAESGAKVAKNLLKHVSKFWEKFNKLLLSPEPDSCGKELP